MTVPTREQTAVALDVLDDLVAEHGDGRAAEALRMLAAERDQLLADRLSLADPGVGGEASGVLWMALRYALGRTSYAPGDVVDALREHAWRLPSWQREAMAAEIDTAIERDAAGWACDATTWRHGLAALLHPPRPRTGRPDTTQET